MAKTMVIEVLNYQYDGKREWDTVYEQYDGYTIYENDRLEVRLDGRIVAVYASGFWRRIKP